MTTDTDQKTGPAEFESNRATAKMAGDKYYFTAEPCLKGHISKRFTSNGWCAECAKISCLEAARKRRENDKEAVNAYQKEWRQANPGKVKAWKEEWERKNPEKVKASRDRFLDSHPGYEAKRSRKRRSAETGTDKKAKTERMARWRMSNPEKAKEIARISSRKRLSTPKGKLESVIRNGINAEIKKGSKRGRRTFDLLGYTPDHLKIHLENLFAPGMTWDNWGRYGWHIDHIVPLSAHNYETPDDIDFQKAWALSNLQPLWATDNLSKSGKLSGPFQPSLALAIVANDNREWEDLDEAIPF